jgi:hypothetical protein
MQLFYFVTLQVHRKMLRQHASSFWKCLWTWTQTQTRSSTLISHAPQVLLSPPDFQICTKLFFFSCQQIQRTSDLCLRLSRTPSCNWIWRSTTSCDVGCSFGLRLGPQQHAWGIASSPHDSSCILWKCPSSLQMTTLYRFWIRLLLWELHLVQLLHTVFRRRCHEVPWRCIPMSLHADQPAHQPRRRHREQPLLSEPTSSVFHSRHLCCVQLRCTPNMYACVCIDISL